MVDFDGSTFEFIIFLIDRSTGSIFLVVGVFWKTN